MNQIVEMASVNDAPVASGSAAPVNSTGIAGLANLFSRPSKAPASATAAKSTSKSPEVANALEKMDQLVSEYQALKEEFFDRSDRALWGHLGNVYDNILRINSSVQKRQIKSDLIAAIVERDKSTMASSSETEAIVVRYVFRDLARQTRNNYVIVFEKALALGIPSGKLFDFLEEHKGIVNVVEHSFDDSSSNAAADKHELKTQREESVKWVRRLFAAMSHCGAKAPLTNALVADWNPTAEDLANVKSADKDAAKYQRGNFVFFVALPDAKAGTYNVVQGFEASRDFEDQLLLQISNRMGANINDLKDAVNELENSVNLTQQPTAQPAAEAA